MPAKSDSDEIISPVEKSGPFIMLKISLIFDFGLSMSNIVESIISVRLCDGISVDIPTAIPELPFIIIFGILAGNCLGSNNVPSKLLDHSTVFFRCHLKKDLNILSILIPYIS